MSTGDGMEENLELRKHYAGMSAEGVIVEMMEKFKLLISLDLPNNKYERRRHNTVETAVNNFLAVSLSVFIFFSNFLAVSHSVFMFFFFFLREPQ